MEEKRNFKWRRRWEILGLQVLGHFNLQCLQQRESNVECEHKEKIPALFNLLSARVCREIDTFIQQSSESEWVGRDLDSPHLVDYSSTSTHNIF